MSSYEAGDIRVLKDLEPVKALPGMYTRVDSPTHIIQEAIDNAADEALAGHAKRIDVDVFTDGSVQVRDNGRGIPVELHPELRRPAIELVFTQLHAGGKFDKSKPQSAYGITGGLHGVGVSVTNALSTRLEVEVKRGGQVYRMAFGDGFVVEPLAVVGECGARTSGTTVRAWPDPKYFESPKVDVRFLESLLRAKAVLCPGLQVVYTVHHADREPTVHDWRFPNGLTQYLSEKAQGYETLLPVFAGERYFKAQEEFAEGEGLSWALGWFDGPVGAESYVNLIPTVDGGTHVAGLREGVFEAVKAFVNHHALLPRGVKLSSDDVCGSMSFVLSLRMVRTQFQGQTKDRLVTREALKMTSQLIQHPLEHWLNTHVEYGKKLADLAIKSALARQKSAQKIERKKSSGIATLPGKLTDCESDDLERRELFLVEGDSAAGPAKLGRDREYQAVLPLRGKVLNSWDVDVNLLYRNREIHDIAVAVGVDAHSVETMDKVDLSGLRYQRVNVMTDADVDGAHIRVLLLTLFLRHFPALVRAGCIHVAEAPLFKVQVVHKGSAQRHYCQDELERDAVVEKLVAEGMRADKITVQRFKGLGEMNPGELWETTMCPDTRRLIPFTATREDMLVLRDTFEMLMGKDSSGRKAWLERDGNLVEADI